MRHTWNQHATFAVLLTVSVLAAASGALAQDTELTPEPKPAGSEGPASQWAVMAGAKFDRGGEMFKHLPTPYTVDFFSTAFSPPDLDDPDDPAVGFFVGAQCKNDATPFENVTDCQREPAIYRVAEDAQGDQKIKRVLDPDEDDPDDKDIGFVGAVAWIDSERALAVGGDGEYPRREPSTPVDDPSYVDPAGDARAWLYEDPDGNGPRRSAWRELEDLPDRNAGDQIPDEMTGMTALDCGTLGTDQQGDCLAGGLQSLWWWEGATGSTSEGFDEPPVTDIKNASGLSDFRFRVRAIQFAPVNLTTTGARLVVAATSGCCTAPGDPLGGPRVLAYHKGSPNTWQSGQPINDQMGPQQASFETLGTAGSAAVPDSYYGLIYNAVVASPGGPAIPGTPEPGSQIISLEGNVVNTTTRYWSRQADSVLTVRSLNSVRLLAADGDFNGTTTPGNELTGREAGAFNNFPDWSVGRLKESKLGIAYTTNPALVPVPNPIACTLADVVRDKSAESCEPVPENVTEMSTESRRLVSMGTYALNAIRFVPGSNGAEAWAAGDRGAIARLGGSGSVGSQDEPDATFVRPRGASPLTDRKPFDAHRPAVSSSLGAVPPLAAQPLETLEEPVLVPYGSPAPRPSWFDSITAFVMARDGSDGWAIGGSGIVPYHFDGERWVRCTQGSLGPPDAACVSLKRAGGISGFNAIARIPLEQDDDPTNDDEFAVMAIGKKALIYHRGAWKADPATEPLLALQNLAGAKIAFSAPDDGWLTATSSDHLTSSLFHYRVDEGKKWPNGKWYNCGSGDTIASCGPGAPILPIGGAGEDLEIQIAGDTVFIAGTRKVGPGGDAKYPFVAARRLGSDDSPWRMEYDPGCPESASHPATSPSSPDCSGSTDTEKLGKVDSFSAVQVRSGGIAGWLLGRFGSRATGLQAATLDATRELTGQDMLMRRDPATGEWRVHTVEDAAAEFLPLADSNSPTAELIGLAGLEGEDRSVIVPSHSNHAGFHPTLVFDSESDRWRVFATPFVQNSKTRNDALARQGAIIAASPDGQGGFWAAARQGFPLVLITPDVPGGAPAVYYYHYTDRAPSAVFEDAPSPVRESISALDGSANGTVWLSTYSDRLYRYDRITGWEGLQIPGWDPGRTVVRPSAAFAIAANESGVGVAVGEEGRIADISLDSVRLNPASGRRCSDDPTPPCGTPRDLHAAAVAPDGSALVSGDHRTMMWRPAGGQFRLVDAPQISLSTEVTGITMPQAGRVWLTSVTPPEQPGAGAQSEIWRGTLGSEGWQWARESSSDGKSISEVAADETGWARLNAIAVDAQGRGLAVGDRGAMLERSPDDGSWDRLNAGYLDDLHSVALPPTGYGDGTLVGGAVGVVLTRVNGAFHYARRSDMFDPVTNGHSVSGAARIVGLAVTAGDSDGEVEAWAASQIPVEAWSRRDPPPAALLHYASEDDLLLDPESRAGFLPDTPAAASGELTFAAFGRSECQIGGHPRFCPEFQGSNMLSEVVTRRIRDEIITRGAESGTNVTALFSGDINTAPGREQQMERGFIVGRPNTPLDVNVTHNTWRDLVATPLIDDGVPLFAALGKADLAGVSECANSVTCPGTRDVGNAVVADVGLSNMWRSTFAEMPSPWGEGDSADSGSVEFDPVDASLLGADVADEGANAHYAADVSLDGEDVARLVVVDNSLGSLAESTVNQNPLEEQQVWLEGALCFDGSPEDTNDDIRNCTRERGKEAIVLANYPTYTYATNISPTDVATDAALFESTLLRYDVDVLIAGRLGWNGLYYTCAPGLHYPAPGQGYPERAPKGLAECAAAAGGADAPSQLSDLASEATDAVSGTPTGALPVVVASGAGGRFGPRGDSDGSAPEGFWRGYAVVRIDPDTGKVTVEQRPVLDWVGLDTPQLVIEPGERVGLHGYGREPAAIDVPLRYIEIDSPAVTHRYDLLLADPDEPWVPCEASDADCVSLHSKLAAGSRSFDSAAASGSGSAQDDKCSPYLCLPTNVATIDGQTGEVRAGNGKYPDTFAIAMLSIGDHSATQPLYFKRSPSFVVAPAVGFPAIPSTPTSTGSAPPPPPPPPPPTPNVPQVNTPTPPSLPPVVPLQAAQPPEPQPPAPPAPPPPTEQPSPLNLTLAPPSITVATPTAVIQPPTPPVNPAPPGGARREARQRQAAAQKSGADSSEDEGTENPDALGQVHRVDNAQGNTATRRDRPGPSELSATRRDRVKPGPSFTPLPGRQASASDSAALYVGGVSLGALVLALGWSTLRPTPRRREPRLPAPAPAWTYGRRR